MPDINIIASDERLNPKNIKSKDVIGKNIKDIIIAIFSISLVVDDAGDVNNKMANPSSTNISIDKVAETT